MPAPQRLRRSVLRRLGGVSSFAEDVDRTYEAEARCHDGLLVLRRKRHAEGGADEQNAAPCGVLVEPVEEVKEWFHGGYMVSVKTL